jgi:hypothetical protein
VFNSDKQKYSGISVRLECFGQDDLSGRCLTIKNQVLGNFSKGVNILTKTRSPLELIGTAIENGWRIVNLIQDMIPIYGDNIDSFIQDMRDARRKFEADCNDKSDRILDGTTVIFHNRSEPYSQLYDILKPKVNDLDDIEVILDAHHVESTVSQISFISGDYDHIVPNRIFIIENTAISQIIPLGSFVEDT